MQSLQKLQNNITNQLHHRHIISEDYDIEEVGGNARNQNKTDQNDDQRFNTEKHHKQQHKF